MIFRMIYIEFVNFLSKNKISKVGMDFDMVNIHPNDLREVDAHGEVEEQNAKITKI